MFFVLNKQKICAYAVSIMTVIILFCVAGTLNTNKSDAIQTSSTRTKIITYI